eukprot:4000367-Amphidinium_carterae.2
MGCGLRKKWRWLIPQDTWVKVSLHALVALKTKVCIEGDAHPKGLCSGYKFAEPKGVGHVFCSDANTCGTSSLMPSFSKSWTAEWRVAHFLSSPRLTVGSLCGRRHIERLRHWHEPVTVDALNNPHFEDLVEESLSCLFQHAASAAPDLAGGTNTGLY